MSEVITKPTEAWIEEHIVEVVERCMLPKAVLGPDGKLTGTYTFNAAGVLRALKLAAKLLGMFSKPENNANQQLVFNFDLPAKL